MRNSAFVATAFVLAACSPAEHAAAPGPAASPGGPAASAGKATARPGEATAPPTSMSASPTSGIGAHTFTLTVSGTARRSSVTYTNPGGQEQRRIVSLPWSRTFTVDRLPARLGVNAHTDAGGALTCSLKVDGDVLKSAMSSGGSTTVDCDTFGD